MGKRENVARDEKMGKEVILWPFHRLPNGVTERQFFKSMEDETWRLVRVSHGRAFFVER